MHNQCRSCTCKCRSLHLTVVPLSTCTGPALRPTAPAQVPALAELMCSMEVVCPSLLNNMHATSRMQQAAGAQAPQGSSSSAAAAAERGGVVVGVGVQTVPGCKVEAGAGVRMAVAPQVLACGVVTVCPTEPQLDGVPGKVAHAREGTAAAQCQASEHGQQQQQQQRQQRQPHQHQHQHQHQQIPFVVTRRVDPNAVAFNLALQSLGPEQRLDLAAQLGRQVAAMHLAGRPAAPWILRAGSADRTAATAAAVANAGAPVHASVATPSSAAGSCTGSANGLEAAGAKAEVPLPSGLLAWLQALASESVQLQPHISSCAGDEGRGSGSGGAQAQGAAAGSWLWHNRHGSIWMSPESEAASGQSMAPAHCTALPCSAQAQSSQHLPP